MEKTKEQRTAEVKALLQKVENSVVSSETPKDVRDIMDILDGTLLSGIFAAWNRAIDKNELRVITTKKGKTLYEVFSTGFWLEKLYKVGNRTLEAKVNLIIR